ncbi:MAG: hypothetical protein GPJ14_08420 [Microcystis aeruginosa G11-01]|nr:hypothetical protein [Microcystis aeruginosa G11-01]
MATLLKLMPVPHSFENRNSSYIAQVNALDKVRVSASLDKAKMRSQATKVRRIVLGEEAK